LHLFARTRGRAAAGRGSPPEIDAPPDWITSDGDLRTLPFHLAEYDGIDGFYAARLVKMAEAA
jgi:hypothetical protein